MVQLGICVLLTVLFYLFGMISKNKSTSDYCIMAANIWAAAAIIIAALLPR